MHITKDELCECVDAVRKGQSVKDLAVRFGVHPCTLRRWILDYTGFKDIGELNSRKRRIKKMNYEDSTRLNKYPPVEGKYSNDEYDAETFWKNRLGKIRSR